MKLNFKTPLSVAIAIGVGLIVLSGYFFGSKATGELTLLGILQSYFLQGAVVVAGVALLVGVYNLAATHAKKIRQGEESIYSFITVLGLLITLVAGTYDLAMTYLQGEPGLQYTRWIFENILYVTWEGRLLACCHDITGETEQGDLFLTPIEEIREIRGNSSSSVPESAFPMCSQCNFSFR